MEWCAYHHALVPFSPDDNEPEDANKKEGREARLQQHMQETREWDVAFMENLNQELWLPLILAAKYLDIAPLV